MERTFHKLSANATGTRQDNGNYAEVKTATEKKFLSATVLRRKSSTFCPISTFEPRSKRQGGGLCQYLPPFEFFMPKMLKSCNFRRKGGKGENSLLTWPFFRISTQQETFLLRSSSSEGSEMSPFENRDWPPFYLEDEAAHFDRISHLSRFSRKDSTIQSKYS